MAAILLLLSIDCPEPLALSYKHMMTKQPISVTLNADNVTWLKGRVGAAGLRSVSELLDQLVTAARNTRSGGAARSVVGTIDIDSSDPLLETADIAVRALFQIDRKPAKSKRRG